ncbi:MAG: hypothetical protein AB7S64_05475 [Bacteroides sp.]
MARNVPADDGHAEVEARKANPRILVVKSKAEKMVGGRMVLKSLEKRGFIFPYQFGVEEMLTLLQINA